MDNRREGIKWLDLAASARKWVYGWALGLSITVILILLAELVMHIATDPMRLLIAIVCAAVIVYLWRY